ncbi:piggyBac transposable element-derived protein 4-like [Leptopilina boulardi]|uniref:piggyBac transposable element-derived protein 4-like n=1 Tax=Leptopilina boulardi TaxID=63433 RepID=UPI0021F56108|nr:piggyBac transposable element-derived protein 4-like [Leptopilina boulardi]
MIPFKGRSSLKQYMPMKPIKRGYKVWCLCYSKTGYVLRIDIYTGKSSSTDFSCDTLGERVVLHLTEQLRNSGALVAFDNFFTSVKLIKELKAKKIFAVGTVRTNRVGLPDIMKEKKKMVRGEFENRTQGCVAAIKWMDSKPVTVLSTAHDPAFVTEVKRKNRDGSRSNISCPEVIADYNKYMGGVDRFDQLKERYAVGKRSKKWYNKRLKVSEEVRTTENKHLPKKDSSSRRCKFCSMKGKVARSKVTCTKCNVPLCLSPCFALFHSK